ncbi:MAG TPA: hypothetical protein V6D28_30890 [Leptolyngbyaceae cyanobacterium]
MLSQLIGKFMQGRNLFFLSQFFIINSLWLEAPRKVVKPNKAVFLLLHGCPPTTDPQSLDGASIDMMMPKPMKAIVVKLVKPTENFQRVN